jgi:hypothetical protein
MMRAVLLDRDGNVVNTILVGEDYSPPDGLTLEPAPDHVGIGWRMGVSGDWVRPERPKEPERVVTYRDLRAVAYRDALGEERGDYVKTIGDVLDTVIAELRARGEAVTPTFRDMLVKIDAVKRAFPKLET